MRTPLFTAAMTTLVVIALAVGSCSDKGKSTEGDTKAKASAPQDAELQKYHDSVASLHYGNPLLY